MAAGNFDACQAITAKWEGGWSDHPSDPGGKTMYGVTQGVYSAWLKSRSLPVKPVRGIERREALEIYYQNYWLASGCERLPPGVDLAIHDYAVNSGPGRAVKAAKATLNLPPPARVKAICRGRLNFVRALRTWKTFGKGWARRIADIEARGCVMAMANWPKGQREDELLAGRGAAAKDKKTEETKAVAAGGGAATAAPGTAFVTDDAAALLLLALMLAALGFAVWSIVRARAAQARNEAYSQVLEEKS